MANIKITELQSSLLEEVSVIDLDAVHGGQAPGVQAVGSTSAVGVGFSSGGSSAVATESFSVLTGQLGAFNVTFGSRTLGATSPR